MTDKIAISRVPDHFDRRVFMLVYGMEEITVDGVECNSKAPGSLFQRAPMIGIKNDATGWSEPYGYINDGFPMDEKHYLEVGCIRSTNPEETCYCY